MRICVSSEGDTLDSQVDPRFGRCAYFIIVDSESLEFEAIQNPSMAVMGGAGIQSGQLIASKDVKVVLTGNVGPNAFQTLQAAGIEVIVGISGSVRGVIERYKKGELRSTQGPSVGSKFGLGAGMGRGMGAGRGMGMGAGRGMGMGPMPQPQAPPTSKDEELRILKEQAEAMKEQLEQITQRIDELTKKKEEED